MAKKSTREKVYVQVIVRFEGSDVDNYLTVFEMPIDERVYTGEEVTSLRFETKELVRGIQKAVGKLL